MEQFVYYFSHELQAEQAKGFLSLCSDSTHGEIHVNINLLLIREENQYFLYCISCLILNNVNSILAQTCTSSVLRDYII